VGCSHYTAIGFSVSDNEINEKSREVNYYWNYPIFPLIDDDFRLFSILSDNFCLWNREMLIGQDFQHYFDGYSISIDLVSTQKPEEPDFLDA
jgi:hypothetical protein